MENVDLLFLDIQLFTAADSVTSEIAYWAEVTPIAERWKNVERHALAKRAREVWRFKEKT